MLTAIQIIAERRIAEALQEGKLDIKTNSWKGKPLPSNGDQLVPPDLRMAYKILKNAGYLPPEIETKKEIQRIEELIAATEDEHVRIKQLKKLNVLVRKLSVMLNRAVQLDVQEEYYRKVVEKIPVKK